MTTVSSKNQWHSTACGLCYINCGIEAMTEGRQIVKVRGDRAHPSTRGYACQKAQRLNYYQNHADRLTTPLRKRSDGSFEAIDWDTAIREIAERLRDVRSRYGGKAFALYGGGGQGNHSGGPYSSSLMRAMGSSNKYSALAQEKTGDFWSAFESAEKSGKPAIIHLKIDPDAITPATTLSAIRQKALSEAGAA